jgi:hypothetical protein
VSTVSGEMSEGTPTSGPTLAGPGGPSGPVVCQAMPREKTSQSEGINFAPACMSAAVPTENAVQTARGQWCGPGLPSGPISPAGPISPTPGGPSGPSFPGGPCKREITRNSIRASDRAAHVCNNKAHPFGGLPYFEERAGCGGQRVEERGERREERGERREERGSEERDREWAKSANGGTGDGENEHQPQDQQRLALRSCQEGRQGPPAPCLPASQLLPGHRGVQMHLRT